jgi:hypothetical protein
VPCTLCSSSWTQKKSIFRLSIHFSREAFVRMANEKEEERIFPPAHTYPRFSSLAMMYLQFVREKLFSGRKIHAEPREKPFFLCCLAFFFQRLPKPVFKSFHPATRLPMDFNQALTFFFCVLLQATAGNTLGSSPTPGIVFFCSLLSCLIFTGIFLLLLLPGCSECATQTNFIFNSNMFNSLLASSSTFLLLKPKAEGEEVFSSPDSASCPDEQQKLFSSNPESHVMLYKMLNVKLLFYYLKKGRKKNCGGGVGKSFMFVRKSRAAAAAAKKRRKRIR